MQIKYKTDPEETYLIVYDMQEYQNTVKSLRYAILTYYNVKEISEEELEKMSDIASLIERNTQNTRYGVMTTLSPKDFILVFKLLMDVAILPMAQIGHIIHMQNEYIEYLENNTASEDIEEDNDDYAEEYSEDIKEISENDEINHLQSLL